MVVDAQRLFFHTSILLFPSLLLGTTQRPGTTAAQAGAAPVRATNVTIHVGLLIPQNSSSPFAYAITASAVSIAMDKVYSDGFLPAGINFTLVWMYEECDPPTAVGYSYQLFTEAGIDVLIAPPCTGAALVAGDIASYYNVPMVVWGQSFATVLNELSVYPPVMSVMPNYREWVLELSTVAGVIAHDSCV